MNGIFLGGESVVLEMNKGGFFIYEINIFWVGVICYVSGIVLSSW